MYKLPNTINGVVVPSTINIVTPLFQNTDDKPVKETFQAGDELVERAVEHVSRVLAGMYGGSTIQKQAGTWIDENNNLIREDSYYVWAYGYADVNQAQALEQLAQALKALFSQDAILLVLNSEPFLV